jgi:hypothetical protein
MPTCTTPPSLDALLASFHAAPDSIARTLVVSTIAHHVAAGGRATHTERAQTLNTLRFM